MRARDDRVFLDDIAGAGANLARFITGRSFEDFNGDLLFRSAVLYQVIVTGEAANRISREFRALHAIFRGGNWLSFGILRSTIVSVPIGCSSGKQLLTEFQT